MTRFENHVSHRDLYNMRREFVHQILHTYKVFENHMHYLHLPCIVQNNIVLQGA